MSINLRKSGTIDSPALAPGDLSMEERVKIAVEEANKALKDIGTLELDLTQKCELKEIVMERMRIVLSQIALH